MANKTIYCFTNKINGKRYIGSTVQEPNKRFNQHMYNVSHELDRHYSYPLYAAIRKYGIENFNFEILASKECTEEEIRLLEAEYIKKFNSVCPNGYNQTNNTLHPINSEETYEKIRETKREKAMRVAEIDCKNNIIQIYRSIIDCAEILGVNERKIASCCRGERKTTQNKRFCWVDELDEPIVPEYTGDFYKGALGTTQIQKTSRKVAKIDLKTKEILATYDTIALAARENKCDASGITKTCKGIRAYCGGYLWKYIDE